MATNKSKARNTLPVLVASRGHHEHPGARVIPSSGAKALYCGFCSWVPIGTAVSNLTVDTDHLAILDMHSYDLGICWADARTTLTRYRKAVQAFERASSGAALQTDTILKTPKAPVSDDLLRHEERAEAAVFAQLLDGGEDYLGFLQGKIAGFNEAEAAAAAGMLALRTIKPPAWRFNPSLAPPRRELDLLGRAHETTDRVAMLDMERELRAWRILMDAWSDARPVVAYAAAEALAGGRSGQGYGCPPRNVTRPWMWLTEADRVRVRELLLRDLTRFAEATGLTHLWPHASIAQWVGCTDLPRFLGPADQLLSRKAPAAEELVAALIERSRWPHGVKEAIRRLDAGVEGTLRRRLLVALAASEHAEGVLWLIRGGVEDSDINDAVNMLPGTYNRGCKVTPEEWVKRFKDGYSILEARLEDAHSPYLMDAAWHLWSATGDWIPCCLPEECETQSAANAAKVAQLKDAWRARRP